MADVEAGRKVLSMLHALASVLRFLPRVCDEMKDIGLLSVGVIEHFDAWAPVKVGTEETEGALDFETTLGFSGSAYFFPDYRSGAREKALLSGRLLLSLKQHDDSKFPGRYYDVECQWFDHLQQYTLKFVYLGAIPPIG